MNRFDRSNRPMPQQPTTKKSILVVENISQVSQKSSSFNISRDLKPFSSGASTYSHQSNVSNLSQRSTSSYSPSASSSLDPSIVFWAHVSVILFCNLAGLWLGFWFKSYAVFNACSIPLCWAVLAASPLVTTAPISSSSRRRRAGRTRIQTSSSALFMYSFRHVFDILLQAHAAPHHRHGLSLEWTSMRMLLLYGSVSVLWSLLSLLPHIWSSMKPRVAGTRTYNAVGMWLVVLGLLLASLPDGLTMNSIMWMFQKQQEQGTSTVNTTVMDLVHSFRLQVITGEFLFWLGVTVINAPALMVVTASMSGAPTTRSYPPNKGNLRGISLTSFFFWLFCACSLWAAVSPPPSSPQPEIPVAETTVNPESAPVLMNEWKMVRTLLLSRHGFLQSTPQPIRDGDGDDDHHQIRGHLGQRHRRVHLHGNMNKNDNTQKNQSVSDVEKKRGFWRRNKESWRKPSTNTNKGKLEFRPKMLEQLFGNASTQSTTTATTDEEVDTADGTLRGLEIVEDECEEVADDLENEASQDKSGKEGNDSDPRGNSFEVEDERKVETSSAVAHLIDPSTTAPRKRRFSFLGRLFKRNSH